MNARFSQKILAGILAAASMASITLTAAAEYPKPESERYIGKPEYFSNKAKPEDLHLKKGEASEFGLIDTVFVDDYGNEYLPNYDDEVINQTPNTALPTSYNSYDHGITTPVQNQNPYGSCWSFAGCATAEGSMIYKGLASGSTNYSEKHMVWFTLGKGPTDTSDPTYGDCENLGYSSYNRGGYDMDPILTLAKWSGAELDSRVPYVVSSSNYSVAESYRYDSYAHLEDATFLNKNDRNAIKQAIMESGELYFTYNHRYAAENEGTIFTYYNPSSNTYDGGHAVTLVGWDDNFSKNNFSTVNGLSKPTSNGAWLIKNSWGTGFGNSGFMWMSYEEATIKTIIQYDMASNTNYENNYQWDGNYDSLSWRSNGFANVFTAKSAEDLKAVSAFFYESGYDCTLKIYTDITDKNNPTTGKLAYSTSFTTSTGYHTYKLPSSISLDKGENFAVWFDTEAYFVRDGYAYADNTTLVGSTWADCTFNACIKAFTDTTNIKVQNVKATAGDSQVTVTWDKLDGATNYCVYYIVDGTVTNAGYVTTNTKTVTGLTNGKKYGFAVTAKVNGAWTKYSSSDYVYATPSARVKNVKATAGDGQVTVTWDKLTGATNYCVYYYVNGTTTNAGYVTTNTKTVTGLTNGTKYGFVVIAKVNGAWTTYTSADYVYATPAVKVKNVKATADDGQVTVTWDKLTGATNYCVYYNVDGKTTNAGYVTTNTKTVTGLTNGTKYGFAVVAKVNGAWTTYTSADYVYATPTVKVKNVKATAGDGQVTVTWDKLTGATNYCVYYYTNGTVTNAGYVTTNTKTVTGLTNGTKYGFVVIAKVNGAWTTYTSADYVYATPSVRVKNVKATAGDSQVTVTWDKLTGATNYCVYYYANGTTTNAGYVTTNTKTVTGLSNGTKYGFVVVAKVNGAWTTYTSADYVYATPVSAVKVKNIALTPSDGQVTVKWDKVTGATNYCVYYYADGTTTNAGYVTTNTKTVTGLTNGKTYGFVVIAKVNGVWSKFTGSDFVYTIPDIRVKNVKATPGNGQVTVTWDKLTGATNYCVYYYANGTTTNAGYVTTNTKTITGLSNGTKYGFVVIAKVDGTWTKYVSTDYVYATPSV